MEILDKRYNDIHLIFNAELHKYKDTEGSNYISTTTILGQYKPKFDNKYWLKKKAKELRISEKELQKQWDTITNEALARGNKTHDGLEDGINLSSKFKNAVSFLNNVDGRMITVADIPFMDIKPLDIDEFKESTDNKYPEIYEVFEYYTKEGYKIYAELGAFLIDYRVSGMIDCLLVRDDQFIIGDWKTNRGGLKFESGYYRKDKAYKPAQLTDVWVSKDEKLLPPVHTLPNCNGAVYNLQLSLYAFMVEYILNIPCAGLWLCHIDSDFILNKYGQPKRFPDGLYKIKESPVEKCTIHKLRYLKPQIQAILNDRLSVVNAEKTKEFNSKTLFN